MKAEEFDEALKRGLDASPTHEVLVEKAVLGWKEFELELLRESLAGLLFGRDVLDHTKIGLQVAGHFGARHAGAGIDRGRAVLGKSALHLSQATGRGGPHRHERTRP